MSIGDRIVPKRLRNPIKLRRLNDAGRISGIHMPRIELMTANGYCWSISTRNVETTLRAWFDEVLPLAFIAGRPGIDDFEVLWPRVNVWPMFAWKHGTLGDPDWITDSRVLGRLIDLPAKNGDDGLKELLRIRCELETELSLMRRE